MDSLSQFRTKSIYQNDSNEYRALLSKKDEFIRVEIHNRISPKIAENIIESQITGIQGLFENSASPYPGMISNEIVCGKKYMPIFNQLKKNDMTISYFTGYLNDRLVFGACTDDQTIYRGILTLFYCKRREQLVQLEIITPVGEFNAAPQVYQQMVESIACRR